jgi:tetratricopeptide (TPR) repeat protein
MKKNYIIIFLMTCLVFLYAACSNELNIDPQNSTLADNAVTDAASVQSLLVAAYDAMGDDDLYGGWFQMTSDLLGTDGDISWNGTFTDPGDIYQKVITSRNGQAEATWGAAYYAINLTNLILENLDLISNAADKERIEGEAKFIRGSIYFDMVRLFAKDWADGDPNTNLGVPIKLKSTNLTYNSEENTISRSTVAEVYTQAISDLTDAEKSLPLSNRFYATKWAARAMLARVYMQQRRYHDAIIKADTVLEKGPFDLVKSVNLAFNQVVNTPEDIFAIQVTNQDGTNALQTFYASSAFNGRRDIRVRTAYEELFTNDPDDERYTQLIYFDAAGRRLSAKYQNQFANISVFRLAEMYLIRAEGNFIEIQAGKGQVGPNTPRQDLQVLRTRANAIDAPVVITLDDIMLERKFELAFEGHFIHDKRRREAVISQPGPFQWNDDKLVLPIPQREVDANPGLKGQQNPGYGI